MFSSSAQAISRGVTKREAKAEGFIARRVGHYRCVSRSLEERPVGGFGEEDKGLSAGERVQVGYAIISRCAFILTIEDIQRLVHTLVSGDTLDCIHHDHIFAIHSNTSSIDLLSNNPIFTCILEYAF